MVTTEASTAVSGMEPMSPPLESDGPTGKTLIVFLSDFSFELSLLQNDSAITMKRVESLSLLLSSVDFLDNERLKATFSSGSLDFDDWTLLISEVETSFPVSFSSGCKVENFCFSKAKSVELATVG